MKDSVGWKADRSKTGTGGGMECYTQADFCEVERREVAALRRLLSSLPLSLFPPLSHWE